MQVKHFFLFLDYDVRTDVQRVEPYVIGKNGVNFILLFDTPIRVGSSRSPFFISSHQSLIFMTLRHLVHNNVARNVADQKFQWAVYLLA